MFDLTKIEYCYQTFIRNLPFWLPDGFIEIDRTKLEDFNIYDEKDARNDKSLTQYFHVVESIDKITLINQEFIIWIIPEYNGKEVKTYTLVSLNSEEGPLLEMGFAVKGEMSSSWIVLRILEKYLEEIQENQSTLNHLEDQMD